jgi:hypothetical protein
MDDVRAREAGRGLRTALPRERSYGVLEVPASADQLAGPPPMHARRVHQPHTLSDGLVLGGLRPLAGADSSVASTPTPDAATHVNYAMA